MSVTHLYTILCDDARVENNGKLIFIGVYTPNIYVSAVPFGLPQLTFIVAFQSDKSDRSTVHANLKHVDTGEGVAELTGLLETKAGKGFWILKFPPLLLSHVGRYSLSFQIEQHAEQFFHDFEVIQQSNQSVPTQTVM